MITYCYVMIWGLYWVFQVTGISAGIYFLQVKGGNTRIMCNICSKWTQRHQSDVIDVVLVSLLLTLNKFFTLLWCFRIDFKQRDTDWDIKFQGLIFKEVWSSRFTKSSYEIELLKVTNSKSYIVIIFFELIIRLCKTLDFFRVTNSKRKIRSFPLSY